MVVEVRERRVEQTLTVLQEKLSEEQRNPAEAAPAAASAAPGAKTAGGKYVPPSLRDGVSKGRGESMSSQRKGAWCD